MNKQVKETPSKKAGLAIGFILVLAFILRIWGIQFGLPELYHADEPIVVNHALAYGTGDFNPHFFKIPPLTSYFLFFCYGIYFLIGRLFGIFSGIGAFQDLFFSDPTSFYLIGRIVLGAFLGTLTVWMLYRLIKKYFSVKLALLASCFLAVAFLHVRDSHYIYLDIPLLVVLLACFFPIFGIVEKAGFRNYFLFGVLAGTAVAIKYNGVFIFVPFFIAHFLKNGLRLAGIFDSSMIFSCVLSVIIFYILNPFAFLEPRFFLSELLVLKGVEGFTGFTHHLIYSLSGGLGLPLLLLAGLGMFLGLFRMNVKASLMFTFVLTYYFVICFIGQPYDRYALPMVPFLCFFAAYSLAQVSSRWVLLVLTLTATAPCLVKDVLSDFLFTKEDIRTIAQEWVESSIPPGTKIAMDTPFFMPRLKLSFALLEKKLNEADSIAKRKKMEALIQKSRSNGYKGYALHFLSDSEYEVPALKSKGFEYVFVYRVRKDQETRFYDELRNQGTLASRLSPFKDKTRQEAFDLQPLTGGPFLWRELIGRERNGQIIEIYKL